MAKRKSINDAEAARLVRALIDTKDWERAKAVLSDVDGKALDAGFKKWAHEKAKLKVEDTALKASPAPPAAPPVEPPAAPPPAKPEVKGSKKDPLA